MQPIHTIPTNPPWLNPTAHSIQTPYICNSPLLPSLFPHHMSLPPPHVPRYMPPLCTPLSSLRFSSLLSPNPLSASSTLRPCKCPVSSKFHHSLCLLRASSSCRACSSRCRLRSPASWNHSARARSSSAWFWYLRWRAALVVRRGDGVERRCWGCVEEGGREGMRGNV